MSRAPRHRKDVLVKVPVLWQASHLEEVEEQGKRTGEKLRKWGNTNHGETEACIHRNLAITQKGKDHLPPAETDKVMAFLEVSKHQQCVACFFGSRIHTCIYTHIYGLTFTILMVSNCIVQRH